MDARSGEVLAHEQIDLLGNAFRTKPEDAYLNILVDRFRGMRVGAPGAKKK